jgi:hypothetical protein
VIFALSDGYFATPTLFETWFGSRIEMPPVIASEAKQSIYRRAEIWIASLRSQ